MLRQRAAISKRQNFKNSPKHGQTCDAVDVSMRDLGFGQSFWNASQEFPWSTSGPRSPSSCSTVRMEQLGTFLAHRSFLLRGRSTGSEGYRSLSEG